MKMNELYRAAGSSKQAFHQYLDKQMQVLDEQQQLLPVISQIRADHPRLSARHMYIMIRPQSMGRDRFEQFCYLYGFKLAVKAFHKSVSDRIVRSSPTLFPARHTHIFVKLIKQD